MRVRRPTALKARTGPTRPPIDQKLTKVRPSQAPCAGEFLKMGCGGTGPPVTALPRIRRRRIFGALRLYRRYLNADGRSRSGAYSSGTAYTKVVAAGGERRSSAMRRISCIADVTRVSGLTGIQQNHHLDCCAVRSSRPHKWPTASSVQTSDALPPREAPEMVISLCRKETLCLQE